MATLKVAPAAARQILDLARLKSLMSSSSNRTLKTCLVVVAAVPRRKSVEAPNRLHAARNRLLHRHMSLDARDECELITNSLCADEPTDTSSAELVQLTS